MNKIQALKNSIINILIITLGAYIGFKVWWAPDEIRFLGIVSFFLIGFGSLFLGISLTRIIINSKIDFNSSTLSNKKKYEIFKSEVGLKKVQIINIFYCSFTIILFTLTSYLLINFINQHEYNQLKNYGEKQKVKIKEIGYKGKGSSYAYFDYYKNEKKYTNTLGAKNYKVGDSAIIIFSIKNPDIIKWSEDFNVK